MSRGGHNVLHGINKGEVLGETTGAHHCAPGGFFFILRSALAAKDASKPTMSTTVVLMATSTSPKLKLLRPGTSSEPIANAARIVRKIWYWAATKSELTC